MAQGPGHGTRRAHARPCPPFLDARRHPWKKGTGRPRRAGGGLRRAAAAAPADCHPMLGGGRAGSLGGVPGRVGREWVRVGHGWVGYFSERGCAAHEPGWTAEWPGREGGIIGGRAALVMTGRPKACMRGAVGARRLTVLVRRCDVLKNLGVRPHIIITVSLSAHIEPACMRVLISTSAEKTSCDTSHDSSLAEAEILGRRSVRTTAGHRALGGRLRHRGPRAAISTNMNASRWFRHLGLTKPTYKVSH